MKFDTSRPAYVILFSAAVSAVFTAAIMTVHVATAGQVRRNERLLEQKALVELFGLGDVEKMTKDQIDEIFRRRIVRSDEQLRDPQTGVRFDVLFALKRDKRPDRPLRRDDLAGIAFPVEGVGFWAPIRGYLAVTADTKTVIGVVFLQQRETPGLGGRITERAWRERFVGLDVSPPQAGGRYIYIGGPEPTGPGDPRYARRLDAITGATQTSMAVDKLLNESIRRFRRASAAGRLLPEGPD